jgi:hypothetical protein
MWFCMVLNSHPSTCGIARVSMCLSENRYPYKIQRFLRIFPNNGHFVVSPILCIDDTYVYIYIICIMYKMGVAILWDTTQQILWVRQFDRSALNLCCCPCQSQRPVLRASCLKPKHSETAQRSEISIRNVQGFETHWTRSLKHITSQCQLCCLTNVFFGGLAGQLGLRFVTVFRNQLPREQIS